MIALAFFSATLATIGVTVTNHNDLVEIDENTTYDGNTSDFLNLQNKLVSRKDSFYEVSIDDCSIYLVDNIKNSSCSNKNSLMRRSIFFDVDIIDFSLTNTRSVSDLENAHLLNIYSNKNGKFKLGFQNCGENNFKYLYQDYLSIRYLKSISDPIKILQNYYETCKQEQ